MTTLPNILRAIFAKTFDEKIENHAMNFERKSENSSWRTVQVINVTVPIYAVGNRPMPPDAEENGNEAADGNATDANRYASNGDTPDGPRDIEKAEVTAGFADQGACQAKQEPT